MPHLLDPLKVGSLELKNRIVMPPMGTRYADTKGEVTEKLLKHYADSPWRPDRRPMIGVQSNSKNYLLK